MAFGDRKGGLSLNAASTAATNSATGSVSVSVGDLIFVNVSMRTDNVATTVGDNLGHSYSAVSAGLDGGSCTMRCYYVVATTAGTLTSVDVGASATGTNDIDIAVDVYEGTFAVTASVLDANVETTTADISSPFLCPASGTLAQADELVIGAAGVNNGDPIADWVGNGSFTLGSRINGTGSQSVGAVTCYLVVSATTSVQPGWTGTTPGDDVLGTYSFKKAAAASFTPWPIQIEPIRSLRKPKPQAPHSQDFMFKPPLAPVATPTTPADVRDLYTRLRKPRKQENPYEPVFVPTRTPATPADVRDLYTRRSKARKQENPNEPVFVPTITAATTPTTPADVSDLFTRTRKPRQLDPFAQGFPQVAVVYIASGASSHIVGALSGVPWYPTATGLAPPTVDVTVNFVPVDDRSWKSRKPSKLAQELFVPAVVTVNFVPADERLWKTRKPGRLDGSFALGLTPPPPVVITTPTSFLSTDFELLRKTRQSSKPADSFTFGLVPPPVVVVPPTSVQKDGDPDYWKLPWFHVEGYETFADRLHETTLGSLDEVFKADPVKAARPAARAIREYAKAVGPLLSDEEAAALDQVAKQLRSAASQRLADAARRSASEGRALLIAKLMQQRDEEDALIALGIY